ncbi:hypothetical protein [Bacillus sp. SG-1]|uniref:hypothetical protein n=1 Tax=Bacillus sp. SG-1 TaxID=161544 RepID=UPI00000B8AEC|nr:hypothetical protein [Bacillus sp. SG-1]AAB06484.1 MnxB [Bacillus sp. (in: firmicutes)]EDL64239.1 hypothetical protein BSG1_00130 [Bacillus sp. SG-1]
MIQLIYISLISAIFLSITAWMKFRKKRLLFDNRYGMTISMSSASIISLILSMQFSFVSPFPFDVTLGLAALSGILIGAAFGCLVRLHAVLSGIFSGATGGLMGAMSGSVIKDPSLCGLPMDTASVLQFNMLTFTAFGTAILFVTIGLILYSLKV